MLITTKDHLVKPRKQKALAKALGAHVIEVVGDHPAPWMNAVEFSHTTASLARHVAAHRVGTANSARRD
jgi:3-oxoadipate enol-lactonase